MPGRKRKQGVKRKYAAAAIPHAERVAIAKMAAAAPGLGISDATFGKMMSVAGYEISGPTLRRYRGNIRHGVPAFVEQKASGAIPVVGQSEEELLVGWVLTQNDKRVKVSAKAAKEWLSNELGIEVCEETARLHMVNNGLSSRLMQAKASGHRQSDLKLADTYYE
jgi:hypothetical protein